jgi:hypothetical protein
MLATPPATNGLGGGPAGRAGQQPDRSEAQRRVPRDHDARLMVLVAELVDLRRERHAGVTTGRDVSG